MYHCCIRLYLAGLSQAERETLQRVPPLERFTHSFAESAMPDSRLAGAADVLLINLRGQNAAPVVRAMAAAKRPDAALILLSDAPLPDDCLNAARDVWPASAGGAALRFYFHRLLEDIKREKDLWEARQFLDATINSVPNLVWYKNKNGIHEKVNDSFCRTVGKTREQVQGRGHAYIWNVERDDPACVESELRVMARRETLISEETIQTGAGKRLLTTYKSPLYNVDGTVMGTVGVAIDVTQERAYEEEIIQKNRTLETIFTTMDCGVMYHSLDGVRLISVNRAALEILGYESAEEMIDDGFDMVAASVVVEDRLRLSEAIRSLQNVGDTVNLEYRVLHKNGDMRHVMGRVKLVEEDGELFCQRFLLDCTAEKLREQQERTENTRRQMELVHALSVDYSLVCFFNLETGIGQLLRGAEGTEESFEAFYGETLDLEESLTAYIDCFVCAEDRETLRRAVSRQSLIDELSQHSTLYVSYRARIGGETVYYQVKAVRAGSWEDSCSIVLGFRNVDDETRREMQKTSLLQDALTRANQASKAKSTFLSSMSHDIRTPMNAIVGFTTLAITHIGQQELVEEYLKKILTSGNHLVSLINDVLDMSRIESGKMHLDETLCSLPDILHGLRSIVQADVRAKQLDFYIDTVDVLDEDVYCDKLRLNQVLLNLISNSIKYTGSGGTVSMRITQKRGAPGGYATYEFVIKDTGIGMSEAFVARIFEPFERERTSTISGIQGTGLGMAITKNIVDMMNGTIEVRSRQGVGTEFHVTLTLRLSDGPKSVQTIPALKNCRALVVDDDFNTCDSVSYMLQQLGLRAEWTMSGREAVLRTRQAIMRRDSYCVYVIDWLMPDMNGVEVARRIRQETGEDVPIIVLTAYDWADIEEEAKEAGVTAFCSKPLFLSELRSCLSAITGEEEGVSEPVRRQAQLRSGRILLAEDNELNQEIAITILTEAGFTVDVASNGQIAVDMLSKSEPGYYRLVLMDVQMPVLDGYGATRAIRALKNPALSSVTILAMTANAFEEDRQMAMQCGMDGHIAKPINIEKLIETLDEILD
ncbi:MAG: response regulator [Oscillospiraceae bacterium]|nr:response regulator [Oscillospiraceae bacterium]